ncbi:MAG: alpha/beta fold hydrolase [Flavobacterium sp.]|nr:alpha/beta fold hydrolase [Pedobacter sp.]
MLKTKTLIINLLICLLLFIAACTNNKINNSQKLVDITFITQDEKSDSISPAGIEELQIKSSGSTIYGFEYIANGRKLHPTVIFLHGLPGNERNLDLAQNLRRAGYNVVFFNYRGSWGSEGTYSFENSIEDVDAVISYITDSVYTERFKVDKSRIALVGHSMGAGIALINGINNKKVKAIAGISVFNPFTLFQGKKAEGNLIGLKEYISTLGMLKTDPNIFLRNMLSKLNDYNIENLVSKSQKPILIIDEQKNNIYFDRYVEKPNFAYKIWDTDLAFTNRRIALSVELKTWLDTNLK